MSLARAGGAANGPARDEFARARDLAGLRSRRAVAQRCDWNDTTVPTINQLLRHGRKRVCEGKVPGVAGHPQKRGVARALHLDSEEAELALRKFSRVRLTTGSRSPPTPGEGHNLQEHSIVLIRGAA